MYRLIALDLDDTLLGKDGKIGAPERAALAEARHRGCDVTLVTARSWRATRPYVAELGLTLPVICMTGAVVYSPEGQPLKQCCISRADGNRLATWADAERWSFRLYYPDGAVYHSYEPDGYTSNSPATGYPINCYVGPITPYLRENEGPLQVALLGNRSVEGVLARLPELPDLVATTYDRQSAVSRTHIMYRAVAKGPALAAYCQERGIPREAVIAMGDGETDRSMIEWAGAGVAMGWAPEAVRLAAGLVTAPDDPSPVATALTHLLGL